MDESRGKSDLVKMDGMERREFLQKILAAALAIPAGGLLLSGCGSGGILEPPNGPVPQVNLAAGVQNMRDEIATVLDAARGIQSAGDTDVPGWIAQLNAQLADVWPAMVAATPQALHDNTSAEMANVLGQLDQFGEPLHYSGPAPAISQQKLQAAWDRAEGMLLPIAAGKSPRAAEATWAFFLMLFLVFPTILDADAFNFANAAVDMDSGHGAASLYGLLHPAGAISCTPCFISALIGGVLGIIMLLFMAMGSQAAMAPSMLFGRDWLVTLVVLAALLVLFVS